MNYISKFFSSSSTSLTRNNKVIQPIDRNFSSITSFEDFHLQEITKRLKLLPRASIKDKAKAAVLIPLCLDTDHKPSVLFTLRSHKVGTHKVR
jgi:hypothetical protein